MEKILIIDFGSQYTQLIARRVREQNVYCEIHPFNHMPEIDDDVRGVILSGSPASVRDEDSPRIDMSAFKGRLPLLGVWRRGKGCPEPRVWPCHAHCRCS